MYSRKKYYFYACVRTRVFGKILKTRTGKFGHEQTKIKQLYSCHFGQQKD